MDVHKTLHSACAFSSVPSGKLISFIVALVAAISVALANAGQKGQDYVHAYRKHRSQIGFSVPRTKTPGGGADAPSRWLQPHQPTSCPPILLHSCTAGGRQVEGNAEVSLHKEHNAPGVA